MQASSDSLFTFISPEEIQNAITRERDSLEYRPTVMAIAHTAALSFLMVQSPNEEDGIFWLLQGGLEPEEDDDPTLAVAREINEEVRGLDVVSIGKCIGGFRNDVPRPRSEFTVGKLYLLYPVLFVVTSEIQPVEQETKAARLFAPHDLTEQLEYNSKITTHRHRKAVMTQYGVSRALR